MSLISKYAAYEKEMKRLQEQMKNLENNKDLAKELKFKEEIEKVMSKFDKSASDVIELLNPKPVNTSSTPRKLRPRRMKIYKNPHTGAVIETYGGNNKELRNWKDDYGEEEVNSWIVRVVEPSEEAVTQ